MKLSFVEVSPSTVTQLNDTSATSLTNCCIRDAAIAASVATKPSMVAMLGWIMPEPLAMPVTVTALPPIDIWREAPLATMSVVMIACAASLQ